MINIALAALMLFSTSVFAQDAPSTIPNDLSYIYQPEFCEFQIALPSAPYETQRCNPDKPNECVTQQSFTQVFDLDATVNIRMTCVESNETTYETYSETTTKAVLRALTTRSLVDTFNTNFRIEEQNGKALYKQGGVVGEGTAGNKPNLYLAQLWIGKGSVLTVEAELIGDTHEAANTLFRDILRSVVYAPVKTAEKETESSENE